MKVVTTTGRKKIVVQSPTPRATGAINPLGEPVLSMSCLMCKQHLPRLSKF